MQFTASTLIAIAALATQVIASPVTTLSTTTHTIEKRKLHFRAWCLKDEVTRDRDLTWKACEMYYQRNTGNQKWDKCGDCRFRINVCESQQENIGGDQFWEYCKINGAWGWGHN